MSIILISNLVCHCQADKDTTSQQRNELNVLTAKHLQMIITPMASFGMKNIKLSISMAKNGSDIRSIQLNGIQTFLLIVGCI